MTHCTERGRPMAGSTAWAPRELVGCPVLSREKRQIGFVDHIVTDSSRGGAAYLDVEVENLIVCGRERHVLIPVRWARHDARRTVRIDMPSTEILALPARLPAGTPLPRPPDRRKTQPRELHGGCRGRAATFTHGAAGALVRAGRPRGTVTPTP
ncbi:MAG: PRC-barrel domain-containing protein [Gemmatimonadetes bacterium]|nr:PRC-barrel domain-containing protein [Gemmatimonadota bacterium]